MLVRLDVNMREAHLWADYMPGTHKFLPRIAPPCSSAMDFERGRSRSSRSRRRESQSRSRSPGGRRRESQSRSPRRSPGGRRSGPQSRSPRRRSRSRSASHGYRRRGSNSPRSRSRSRSASHGDRRRSASRQGLILGGDVQTFMEQISSVISGGSNRANKHSSLPKGFDKGTEQWTGTDEDLHQWNSWRRAYESHVAKYFPGSYLYKMRFLAHGLDEDFDKVADGHIFDSLIQALGTGGPAMRMLVRKWRRGVQTSAMPRSGHLLFQAASKVMVGDVTNWSATQAEKLKALAFPDTGAVDFVFEAAISVVDTAAEIGKPCDTDDVVRILKQAMGKSPRFSVWIQSNAIASNISIEDLHVAAVSYLAQRCSAGTDTPEAATVQSVIQNESLSQHSGEFAGAAQANSSICSFWQRFGSCNRGSSCPDANSHTQQNRGHEDRSSVCQFCSLRGHTAASCHKNPATSYDGSYSNWSKQDHSCEYYWG